MSQLEDKTLMMDYNRIFDEKLSKVVNGCRSDSKKMKRQIANSNERKRMQQINAGFESLRCLLPSTHDEKISKAAILQQAVETIVTLKEERDYYKKLVLNNNNNNVNKDDNDNNDNNGGIVSESNTTTIMINNVDYGISRKRIKLDSFNNINNNNNNMNKENTNNNNIWMNGLMDRQLKRQVTGRDGVLLSTQQQHLSQNLSLPQLQLKTEPLPEISIQKPSQQQEDHHQQQQEDHHQQQQEDHQQQQQQQAIMILEGHKALPSSLPLAASSSSFGGGGGSSVFIMNGNNEIVSKISCKSINNTNTSDYSLVYGSDTFCSPNYLSRVIGISKNGNDDLKEKEDDDDDAGKEIFPNNLDIILEAINHVENDIKSNNNKINDNNKILCDVIECNLNKDHLKNDASKMKSRIKSIPKNINNNTINTTSIDNNNNTIINRTSNNNNLSLLYNTSLFRTTKDAKVLCINEDNFKLPLNNQNNNNNNNHTLDEKSPITFNLNNCHLYNNNNNYNNNSSNHNDNNNKDDCSNSVSDSVCEDHYSSYDVVTSNNNDDYQSHHLIGPNASHMLLVSSNYSEESEQDEESD